MLGEQLRCLEEYLRAKKMDGTLHALRKDLMARVPPRPTQQLLSLLARGERKENVMAQPSAVPKKNEPNMKKRKGDKTM